MDLDVDVHVKLTAENSKTSQTTFPNVQYILYRGGIQR